MKRVRIALSLVLALLLVSPLAAGPEKGKGKKGPAKQPPCPAAVRVEKMLEGVTITDEQKAKLGEIQKEFGPKLMEALKKADVLTPEQKKAQAEAAKAAKAAGKKGKEAAEAAQAAVKLTDEQKAKQAEARKEVGELTKQLHEKVLTVLTPEQKKQVKQAHHAKKPAK